jgi:CBS domain-containing protein
MLKLDHVRVADVMHAGILTCAPDDTLRDVAAIMAAHHVHAVAVRETETGRVGGVVSDLDVAAAVASGAQPTASGTAATEPLAVSSKERLTRAAALMAEHGISHLIVTDAAGGHPIGVLSTLDIAAVYGHGAVS